MSGENIANMTWETMQPRERDAWLAKYVMGQCPHPKPWKYYCIEDGNDCDSGFTCPQCGEDMYGKGVDGNPHYTTDPAAAMGLLEEMSERDWEWQISKGRTAYGVTLVKYDPENFRRVHESGFALPAAISACVFRAIGGEND